MSRISQDQANKVLIGGGLLLVIGSVIAWPISAMTFARHEPVTVLGLSWFAIILSGATFLLQALTKRDVNSE